MAEPAEDHQSEIDALRGKQADEARALFFARRRLLHELPPNHRDLIAAIDTRLSAYPKDVLSEQSELLSRMFQSATLQLLHPHEQRARSVQISDLPPDFVESVRRSLLVEADREVSENEVALAKFPKPMDLAREVFTDWLNKQKRAPMWTIGRAAYPGAADRWPHLCAEDGGSRGYFMAWDAEREWRGGFYKTSEVQFEIEEEMTELGLKKATVFATVTGDVPPPRSKFRIELVRSPGFIAAITAHTALVRRRKLLAQGPPSP